ncbi:MAG TPA: DUF6506 family protein [Methanomassiliicoccales archaeon]|nr:DUF6506 family protein [Methanomassiliicoccales archaeon]
MAVKRFKTAFVAMAPDAEPSKHRSVIDTSTSQLTSVLVRDEDEAVKVCADLVKHSEVQSILLCPGFTHAGVAKVAAAVGREVSVNVSRGDGPSNGVAMKYLKEAGYGVH